MKNKQKAITNTDDIITISRSEYKDLQSKIAEQSAQIDWLMEQLRLSKKKQFGASSERSEDGIVEQLSLTFNETEAYQPKEELPATIVKSYERKSRSGSVEDVVPNDAPVKVVEHRLSEEERVCAQCGEIMQEIGKEIRRTLVLVPATYFVREDHFFTYACKNCKVTGTEVPIQRVKQAKPVIAGGFASPEAIAHILTQKFVMYSPLYRQEKEWQRMGLKLTRQTMSNWVLKATKDWLEPVYDALHEKLLQSKVLHADETTVQVLREPGKAAQSKSYMWLYRTSGDAQKHIVLYRYAPNRKAENPKDFLAGFSGYLHTDGYSGYHNLPPEISVVGCWAHSRRKFDEALNSLPKTHQKGSAAAQGIAYCSALFKIEEEIAELSFEERQTMRQKEAKPVLDAILVWAKTQQNKTAPKSAMGKALYYLLEQWPYLVKYLEDGRLELSNNRAERSIKPFVMGRKNFLFANTPYGAKASAIAYSLIETAKENGLHPYEYLLFLLSALPCRKDENIENYLPGGNLVPEHCRCTQPKEMPLVMKTEN